MSDAQLYMAELPPALLAMVQSAEQAARKAERERPLAELKRQIADAPPVRSLAEALSDDFGMIAEIKECSPSMGAMLASNVAKAAELYAKSSVVKAISVLTNTKYFGAGMMMERLRQIKTTTGKPTLRKEFVVDPYQLYEARAYGADAVLLMANVLTKEGLRELFDVCGELGMDALFEIHTKAEIEKIPANARIYGINSRSFKSSEERFAASRARSEQSGGRASDLTTDLANFQLCKELPARSIKVAESGIDPSRCAEIRQMGFNAILVGTSLLIGPEPIERVLAQFEEAIGRMGRMGAIH
jgi:indole-3-glycerol phosphate synthase